MVPASSATPVPSPDCCEPEPGWADLPLAALVSPVCVPSGSEGPHNVGLGLLPGCAAQLPAERRLVLATSSWCHATSSRRMAAEELGRGRLWVPAGAAARRQLSVALPAVGAACSADAACAVCGSQGRRTGGAQRTSWRGSRSSNLQQLWLARLRSAQSPAWACCAYPLRQQRRCCSCGPTCCRSWPLRARHSSRALELQPTATLLLLSPAWLTGTTCCPSSDRFPPAAARGPMAFGLRLVRHFFLSFFFLSSDRGAACWLWLMPGAVLAAGPQGRSHGHHWRSPPACWSSWLAGAWRPALMLLLA